MEDGGVGVGKGTVDQDSGVCLAHAFRLPTTSLLPLTCPSTSWPDPLTAVPTPCPPLQHIEKYLIDLNLDGSMGARSAPLPSPDGLRACM